jgi:opacity protein-like surface antigen
MKTLLVIAVIFLSGLAAWGQERMFTLSGGYAFADPEEYDETATGYRINGLFDLNRSEGKLSHGFNIGYVQTKFSTTTFVGETDVSIRSWPIYYAPKLFFGNNDKIRPFLKGALGMHFSKFTLTGPSVYGVEVDEGFFGGFGLGILLRLQDNLFLNLEYEWAYQSNSYYGNGFLNTAQLGLGFKF